jgi:starch-binding outer membrane protein, SusD/RagB family
MKHINKLLFLSLCLVIASCADNLEVAPVDTVNEKDALKTSADVEALVVGAYDAIGDGDLLGGNMLRDAELLADDGDVFWDGTFVAPGEIWTKDMQITNDQAENTWLDGYRTINTCNLVLANLNLVVDAKKQTVEGDAKFVRGLMYFELVKLYAKTWTDGNPASNPGLPLILTPTTVAGLEDSKKVTRASVQAVYQQIISDLTDAEGLLPDDNGFFANTYVVSAILSRVYLMQNNYADAAAAADRVIQSGSFALLSDYADNFNKTSAGAGSTTSSEDVFSIQVTDQDGVNNMNTFFASSDFSGRGDIYIEPAHFDRYESGDERLDVFYDDERTGKWNNQFGNVNIVRLAEMYLTRAEANFREGTSIGATPLNDINTIRNRVGLAGLGALTIDDILNERLLELAFEGHLLHDLKRTQRSVGSLSFDADELVFPIPQRERIINPGLTQNPGYGSN